MNYNLVCQMECALIASGRFGVLDLEARHTGKSMVLHHAIALVEELEAHIDQVAKALMAEQDAARARK